MDAVANFLSGKKTYLMALVYGLDAAGAQLGWWSADGLRAIMEQVFIVIFARMGIAASGPVVATK